MENKIKIKNKKPAITEKSKRILGKSKSNKIILTLFILYLIILILLMGCGPKTPLQQDLPSTSTQDVKAEGENGEGDLELGILTPSQIDSSMVDSYVKVRGKITMVNRDSGGLALWLGDDKDKVGVRIENKFWEGLTSEEQSQYEKGKTITAEGMLVLAGGNELFIVLGTEPPVSEGQAQLSEGEFWDDLGCFSKDCENMPPGMTEMCEDYASGIFSWYYFTDCSVLPEGPCRELCEREKAKATPFLPDQLPTYQKPGKSYQPQMNDYITGDYKKTDKSLVFAIGMHDLWGKVVYQEQSEDNRYFVVSSMERVQEIGSELVMISDFAVLDEDLSIRYELQPSGAHTMGQNELKEIVDYAKSNGQNVILITNLMASEDVKTKIFNSSEQVLDKLFEEWSTIITKQAIKAEYADVDYFIINPRDAHFNAFEPTQYLNELYSDLISKVSNNFSGKVSIWWDIYPKGIWFLDNKVLTFYNQIDCIMVDCAVPNVFSNTTENIDSIEAAWLKVLDEPGFKKIEDKETFLLISMPSYDGAMQSGWIEPGTTYPEGMYQQDWREQALVYEGLFRALYKTSTNITGVISYGYWWTDTLYPEHWMRHDLGHSIRNKDAEHVFNRWSHIFN